LWHGCTCCLHAACLLIDQGRLTTETLCQSPLDDELCKPSLTQFLTVTQMLSGAVRASTVHPMARTRMDENFTFYEDALGACERILKTPIPLTYTR